MLLFAMMSLLAVGVGVHVAVFGWRRAPAYRVDLTASKRWWVGVLFGAPILLGGFIVIGRHELSRYIANETQLEIVMYLIGFVLAVVFALLPTTPEENEDGSLDHTA